MLNSESMVIIRIKGEHLLYSKISGGMIGYVWGNVCYIVHFPPGEYLLYSKVSGGWGEGCLLYSKYSERKVCYAEGLLYDTGTVNSTPHPLTVAVKSSCPHSILYKSWTNSCPVYGLNICGRTFSNQPIICNCWK